MSKVRIGQVWRDMSWTEDSLYGPLWVVEYKASVPGWWGVRCIRPDSKAYCDLEEQDIAAGKWRLEWEQMQ